MTDAWRVVPRFAFIWFCMEASRGLTWYYGLDERSPIDHLMGAAFLALAPTVYKFYVDSGRNWNNR